jgi:hypothetical protein
MALATLLGCNVAEAEGIYIPIIRQLKLTAMDFLSIPVCFSKRIDNLTRAEVS